MRPIRAGKIHVPLAATGGKNGNNRKKKGTQPELASHNSSEPFCPSHLLFPVVFNGMGINQLGGTQQIAGD